MFEDALPLACPGVAQGCAPDCLSERRDFRSEVAGGWENVYPPVRERMDELLTSQTPTTFKGTGCVRRSILGWLFAQFCRPLGSPLVWKQGEDVTTVVRVAPTRNGKRCWHRLFIFPDESRHLVETAKVVDTKLGFLDVVGRDGEGALATRMHVWAEGRSLHFASTAYLLRFRWFNIRIPLVLTPGNLIAEHRDVGGGWFRYILRFDHPVFGQTFYQDGLFRMLR